MNQAIKELRKFFKSDLWYKAVFDDQPVVSDQDILTSEAKDGNIVGIDTKINLALDLEGYFNEIAHKYMVWRKENNLPIE